LFAFVHGDFDQQSTKAGQTKEVFPVVQFQKAEVLLIKPPLSNW
jgi:hypothetical protein